jgi:hypothetical protein
MQQKELQGWKNQLPGQASLATTAATLAQDVRIDTFDEDTFHRYLINFIVADDQVRVVCFRLLIMLIFSLFLSH